MATARSALSERQLHYLVADALALFLPRDIVWTTVRNEGLRGRQEQADIKRKRMRAGWPDLHLVGRHRETQVLVAVYIELKRPGEKPAPEQKEIIAWLDKSGAVATWADSLEKVLEIVDLAFGLGLRGQICGSAPPSGRLPKPPASLSRSRPAADTPTEPERMTAAEYRARQKVMAAGGGNVRAAATTLQRTEQATRAALARWGRRS